MSGWELWMAHDAVVRHEESAATGGRGAPLAMYYFVRNRHLFVRKFRRGRLVYKAFLAYEFADVAGRAVIAVLRGRIALCRAVCRGLHDAVRDKP